MGEIPGDGSLDGVGEHGELAARRAKLEAWRAEGTEPFGCRFEVSHHSQQIRQECDALTGATVSVAGRVMSLRQHGGVAFADLQDRSGRIQLFARRDRLGPAFASFLRCDLGDIVGVNGAVLRTRTGEPSVELSGWTLLSKALRPLPSKWHGLRDVDLRYRHRYVDLTVNPEVRDLFIRRSRLVASLRRTLEDRGFLEVETPVLQSIASGAAARPFVTHHNALDCDFHLRISLELPLKRLLVGGLERVYEIGRVFRNEGIDTRHNPEYTLLECYEAFGDLTDMMDLTEALVAGAARAALGTTAVSFRGQQIELAPPWPRRSIVTELARHGVDVLEASSVEALAAAAAKAGVGLAPDRTWGQAVDDLVEALIQPELIQPTFLCDHPVAISPLAKAHPDEPRIAQRFEAIVAGMELANAFNELNDPDEQGRRFEAQQAERAQGNTEAQSPDQDFVTAMEYGMPPAGGLGIGVDRLAMLVLGAASIREVLLFPTLRPE